MHIACISWAMAGHLSGVFFLSLSSLLIRFSPQILSVQWRSPGLQSAHPPGCFWSCS